MTTSFAYTVIGYNPSEFADHLIHKATLWDMMGLSSLFSRWRKSLFSLKAPITQLANRCVWEVS